MTHTPTESFVFDHMAADYDSTFSHSPIGKMQRERVYEYLEKYKLLIPGKRCLEINAGTGVDALYLAEKGLSVVATDKSPEMVRMIQKRTSDQDVRAQTASFAALREQFAGERFDLIFSNFGGLNCVSKQELQRLSQHFAGLLEKKGKLIFVIMGRTCLWEILYFAAKGQFRKAFRRRKKGGVAFGEDGLRIHYFDPKQVHRAFGKEFEMLRSVPIGLFIPPSYLDTFFENRPKLLARLQHWERKWAKYLHPSLADHYLVELEKR